MGRLLIFLCAAAVPLHTTGQQIGTVVLVGATIIDGTGREPVTDGVVVVRQDRLVCVGTREQCAIPPSATRQDVSGKWIIPGLVDAHVHYSQTGWADGRPDAQDMRDRFPYSETIARLRDPTPFYRANLCAGVTATFDVGGYPWTWSLRQPAEQNTSAPHVSAAGPLLSTRDHWLNVPGERQFLHIGSDSATVAGAQYLIANGTDAIKVWFLAGANSPDTAVFAARLMEAGRRAQAAGIPLIVHATNLWGATQAVRAGARLLVHGVSDQLVDDEFLRLARAAGTIYTPTLVVTDGYFQLRARKFEADKYELACVDPATRAKAFLTDSLPNILDPDAIARSAEQARRRRYEIEFENVRRVHAAGIPVAMGTDAGNPLTLHGPSVYLELEALAEAGLSSMHVLVSATRVGALAMRRERDFGTLEAGKIADLVVLNANPLDDVRNFRQVEAVMRAGVLRRRAALIWP
jgi:imidazolonepropionase-like amidohydrolase